MPRIERKRKNQVFGGASKNKAGCGEAFTFPSPKGQCSVDQVQHTDERQPGMKIQRTGFRLGSKKREEAKDSR